MRDSAFDPSLWNADLAILNARIITLDPTAPAAEAVLVRRGRIAAIGSTASIRSQAQGARILDLGGRTVVPGFVDTHVHIEWSSAATVLMGNLWTPPPKSIAEVLSRLRTQVDATPVGRWVVAEGDFSQVAEKRLPTLDELDGITQRHPLVVFEAVHTNVANSLAAKAMGYLTYADEAQAKFWSSGQPFTGGVVERDSRGRPGPAGDMVMRLPRDLYSIEELKGAIRKVAKQMFVAGGVTSASPVCLLSSNEYSADQQLQAMGELPLRLRAYFMAPFSVSVESVLDTGFTRGFGNDMFRVGGFKLIMDGGFLSDQRSLVHDTDNATESRRKGRQIHHYTIDEFTNLLTLIHGRELQAITHCVSAEGAEMVTKAVEEVRRRLPDALPIRHRIEHQRPQDMELARRQKAAQVYFTMIAPQAGLESWSSPDAAWGGFGATYRSWVKECIHPILMSDKCGGEPVQPRPLFSIAAACNTMDKRGSAPAGETVDFDDALRMWTLWAAESTHQEEDRGTISVGKLGDFAVLSGNPRHPDPQSLFELKVEATILGGKVVYGA